LRAICDKEVGMRGVGLVLGASLGLALGACGKKQEAAPTATVKPSEATAPADKPADKPVVKQADDPVVKQADEPVVKKTDEPVVKKADEPVVKKADEPVVKKTDEPGARHADAPKPGDAKKPRKKLEKKDREAATAARKAFNELLDAGRKAVKGDDPTLGMQKLEEALTKVPGHPGALGELGWAAYRAGPAYFDKSMEATRKALAASKKPKQKGALWYNLGRVAEDQGNLSLAIDSYRESLAYRPGNDVVQKRLEELLAKVGGKSAEEGIEKLDDVCQGLRDEQGCETAASAEGFIAHSCDCGSEIVGPEEGFGRAALMRVTGQAEHGGSVDSTYLVIEVAAKWHVVTMVGNDWNPGMGYVSNTSSRQAFTFRTIGGKPALWVEYENSSDDLDPGVYTAYSDWSRTLTLCAFEGGAPTCVSVPLGNGSEVSKFTFEEGEEIPEGMGPDKETKERWSTSAALGAGGAIEITLDAGSDPLPDEVKALPGTWTLDKLFLAPGVIKHAL